MLKPHSSNRSSVYFRLGHSTITASFHCSVLSYFLHVFFCIVVSSSSIQIEKRLEIIQWNRFFPLLVLKLLARAHICTLMALFKHRYNILTSHYPSSSLNVYMWKLFIGYGEIRASMAFFGVRFLRFPLCRLLFSMYSRDMCILRWNKDRASLFTSLSSLHWRLFFSKGETIYKTDAFTVSTYRCDYRTWKIEAVAIVTN